MALSGNSVSVVLTAEDQASKTIKAVKDEAGGLGKTLGDVSKIAGGFLAAQVVGKGVGALQGYISGALTAASDLEQSIGGVESVFKDSAQTILDWGKTADQQAGLSRNSFNQIAGPLGAMLKSAGFEMDEVTTRTIDLTKKGADLAATFGGSVTDAMEAISSLMRGESNPIERYGVAIKQSDVNLRALANTGKKSERDLTALELTTARLDLLFEQTADSTGQFAREADTAAGKQERLRASQENMAAQIGQYMLPLQVKWTELQMKATQFLATQVIPTIDTFAKYIRFVWQDGDKLNDFLADLPPGLRGFAMAVADVVIFVKENWGTISAVFEAAKEHVRIQIEGAIQTVQGFGMIISGLVTTVKALFEGDWKTAWDGLGTIIDGAWTAFEGIWKRTFGILPDLMLDIGKQAGEKLLEGLTSIPGVKEAIDVASAVGGALGDVASGFNNFLRGRASGGPVTAGSPYVVGEQGPEVFVPRQPGYIVPNHAMGGSTVINYYYNTLNGSPIATQRELEDLFRRMARMTPQTRMA